MWRNKTETQITKAWVRPVSVDAWLTELSMALWLSYLREPQSHFWGLWKPRLLGYSWVSDSVFLVSRVEPRHLRHLHFCQVPGDAEPCGETQWDSGFVYSVFPRQWNHFGDGSTRCQSHGHMMGIAAESYLGSIRWLITEEQQLWIQTQKEWHIDKIFGGRTIRLMPDLMWRETAYWKVILKMKKVQK